MNSYYMRAASRAELVAIGVDLGLLVDDADGTRAASTEIVWDEIGLIYEPTGAVGDEGEPVLAPICNEGGTPYWHANLYLPVRLADWAQARYLDAVSAGDTVAAERIAVHIADSAQYFPLDESGEPRYPNNPRRVLWTD